MPLHGYSFLSADTSLSEGFLMYKVLVLMTHWMDVAHAITRGVKVIFVRRGEREKN